MSNTLENSQPLYHKSSKKESSMFQDTEIISFPKIRSSDSQDVYLLPNDPSGTELDASQNTLPLCEKQPSETDDQRPLATQAFYSVPKVNRQLMTEIQNFPDNRCDTVQEIHMQTKLSELNVSSSLKHSVTHQQSRNEQILSQGSYPVSYKLHQSASNVSNRACSVPCGGFRNEFNPSRITNIGSYFQYSGGTSRIQGSPLQSFQQSKSVTNYIQSPRPQRLQLSEGPTNYIRNSHTQKPQRSEIDPNVIKFSSTIGPYIGVLNSPMILVPKESVVNQHLCSLNQQPVESRTRGIQVFPQLPQIFKLNSPTENHLSYSPYSRSQQQSNDSSRDVQQAVIIYSPIPPPTPFLDNFLQMCCVMDQNRSSDHAQDRIFLAKHYDLTALQCPYADRSEIMSILVYGPVVWTTELIKAFSRGLPLKFVSPFSLVFQGIVTRCGIETTLSVWLVDDLNKSIKLLKSSCASLKTTIIFVFNVIEQRLQSMIEFIRREVGQSTPIIFVVSKKGGRKTLPGFTKTGFKLKAKYNLSGFLLCHVDSLEEVDAVFFTAIDVSSLITTI